MTSFPAPHFHPSSHAHNTTSPHQHHHQSFLHFTYKHLLMPSIFHYMQPNYQNYHFPRPIGRGGGGSDVALGGSVSQQMRSSSSPLSGLLSSSTSSEDDDDTFPMQDASSDNNTTSFERNRNPTTQQPNAFQSQTMRELQYLRHMRHENASVFALDNTPLTLQISILLANWKKREERNRREIMHRRIIVPESLRRSARGSYLQSDSSLQKLCNRSCFDLFKDALKPHLDAIYQLEMPFLRQAFSHESSYSLPFGNEYLEVRHTHNQMLLALRFLDMYCNFEVDDTSVRDAIYDLVYSERLKDASYFDDMNHIFEYYGVHVDRQSYGYFDALLKDELSTLPVMMEDNPPPPMLGTREMDSNDDSSGEGAEQHVTGQDEHQQQASSHSQREEHQHVTSQQNPTTQSLHNSPSTHSPLTTTPTTNTNHSPLLQTPDRDTTPPSPQFSPLQEDTTVSPPPHQNNISILCKQLFLYLYFNSKRHGHRLFEALVTASKKRMRREWVEECLMKLYALQVLTGVFTEEDSCLLQFYFLDLLQQRWDDHRHTLAYLFEES